MSRQPRTVLVLGGIRSGKSEFAESLVGSEAVVRYVATAIADDTDAEWSARLAAHRDRRSDGWTTEEVGKTPDELAPLIADAAATDTILVDDIGGWLSAMLDRARVGAALADDSDATPAVRANDLATAVEALAVAVGTTAARVVIVSPEVGMSVIPATPLGRTFADACGSVNRALATACDGVVLVVAGQPTWIKATAGRLPANVVVDARTPKAARQPVPVSAFDLDLPDDAEQISLGMTMPLPDTVATTAAIVRLESLPVPGSGIGAMVAAVAFAAGAQGTPAPQPFRQVRVVQVHGVHEGVIATGDTPERWAAAIAATRDGTSPLARLAAEAGAAVEIIDAGVAAPIEDGDAATTDEIDLALRRGWAAANAAADRGDDVIVLAATGPGVDSAAAALVAAVTMSESPTLLGRVWHEDGRIDDAAWMHRCIAIRDALLRLRKAHGPNTSSPTALACVGGPALATATGLLLGAASRRTPVLIDGPVGAAAALVARDYAAQTRMWCLLTDVAGQPTVRAAADLLGLDAVVGLGLGLGEGCNALALLPMIQSMLSISFALAPATDAS
jgi:adenosyl cobinamide kinase/adenosyl cobinamide phosphate guanylyltransferase/NaMN:DMB phosphoribosyltransferase